MKILFFISFYFISISAIADSAPELSLSEKIKLSLGASREIHAAILEISNLNLMEANMIADIYKVDIPEKREARIALDAEHDNYHKALDEFLSLERNSTGILGYIDKKIAKIRLNKARNSLADSREKYNRIQNAIDTYRGIETSNIIEHMQEEKSALLKGKGINDEYLIALSAVLGDSKDQSEDGFLRYLHSGDSLEICMRYKRENDWSDWKKQNVFISDKNEHTASNINSALYINNVITEDYTSIISIPRSFPIISGMTYIERDQTGRSWQYKPATLSYC